ncbi:MAG: HmuY family protein, partial [Myxococcota bacterium]
MWKTSVTLLIPLFFGCASDLSERLEGQQALFGDREVLSLTDEEGSTVARVDASSSDEWVHVALSLEDARTAETLGDIPTEWDIAFQRFRIRVNGGASGSSGVEVATLVEEPFDELETAPSSGYGADEEDNDQDGDVESVFETANDGWYVYDFSVHTLTPRPIVYVVKTHDEQFFKLEFLSYYDDAGSSG